VFLYIFGLRLSGGSRGLSLRLRFKVRVKVKVKVKVKGYIEVRGIVKVEVKGVKVYTCPIDESIVLRHYRRFLVEIRSSRRSNASIVKLICGFEL
jgi:hypothetical protein